MSHFEFIRMRLFGRRRPFSHRGTKYIQSGDVTLELGLGFEPDVAPDAPRFLFALPVIAASGIQ